MGDVLRPLFTRQEINRAVKKIGAAISRDYRDEEVVCVCILKGSFMFTADLVREIKVPAIIDFIRVSSYGNGMSSQGEVIISKDLDIDISRKKCAHHRRYCRLGFNAQMVTGQVAREKAENLEDSLPVRQKGAQGN